MNRRRIETPELPPRNEPMEIVWKDISSNPTENLIRLSQFTSAYATATMDKDTEISVLLKEKEEKISQLEQQLETEKASVNRQVAEQLAQLQQSMEVLKISHEADISIKTMQLQDLQQGMEIYNDVTTIEEFIKEVL